MSFDQSGLNSKVIARNVIVEITDKHPLIKLGNALNWTEVVQLILPDLKATTSKLKWWLGRPLQLRIHVGAYLLQQLFNKTDRQIEYSIKDNAAYQLFCGRTVVKKWHCPDHTKIEEFRSRLSPETQQRLANQVVQLAQALGFVEPNHLDIDSTTQEANMAYPSDIHLMSQLAIKAKKVWAYLQKRFSTFTFEPLKVDLKAIKAQARRCFFLKTTDIQEKNNQLSDLWCCVYGPVTDVIKRINILDELDLKEMPWQIRRLTLQLKDKARDYLLDVCEFLNKGTMVATKILSFHLEAVACFNKKKANKKFQFGRAFQLGRVGGNFLIVAKNDSVRMDDKASLKTMVQLHQKIFPDNTSPSIATDKGYYSKKNADYVKKITGSNNGIQKPVHIKNLTHSDVDVSTELINRRAGIEPLIGHAKHGGQLGRSRMKYDHTTESAGYAAILGFNGRQLIRHLMNKYKVTTLIPA